MLAAVALSGCTPLARPVTPAAGPSTTAPIPATTVLASRTTTAPTTTTTPPPPAALPRGGRLIFPAFRVVAYYGAAGTAGLGVLGAGSPEQAADRLLRQATAYAFAGRPVLPALELIATIADRYPGADGNYSRPSDDAVVQRYLASARRVKGLLVLDIQPGRGDFLAEAERYQRFLELPDVGLALDPEWSMRPGQVPGTRIGSTDAATINRVSAWLAGIVRRGRLPQKLLVVHQFTTSMVAGKGLVLARPGLAITFHIDGFGSQGAKLTKYRQLASAGRWFNGIKLFYRQDVRLLTPAQAMALRPRPDLVTYQ